MVFQKQMSKRCKLRNGRNSAAFPYLLTLVNILIHQTTCIVSSCNCSYQRTATLRHLSIYNAKMNKSKNEEFEVSNLIRL